MSVLHFIARDYENSVLLFKEALKYDTSNYSLWNKLGATLAHLGRAHEAIDAYHRALELKPNYVRVWVNLGIAHSYIVLLNSLSCFYNFIRVNMKKLLDFILMLFLLILMQNMFGIIYKQLLFACVKFYK